MSMARCERELLLAKLEAKSLDELAYEVWKWRWFPNSDRSVVWNLYHRLKDALKAYRDYRQVDIQDADDVCWLATQGIGLVFCPDRFTGGHWEFAEDELVDEDAARRERVRRELDEKQMTFGF